MDCSKRKNCSIKTLIHPVVKMHFLIAWFLRHISYLYGKTDHRFCKKKINWSFTVAQSLFLVIYHCGSSWWLFHNHLSTELHKYICFSIISLTFQWKLTLVSHSTLILYFWLCADEEAWWVKPPFSLLMLITSSFFVSWCNYMVMYCIWCLPQWNCYVQTFITLLHAMALIGGRWCLSPWIILVEMLQWCKQFMKDKCQWLHWNLYYDWIFLF